MQQQTLIDNTGAPAAPRPAPNFTSTSARHNAWTVAGVSLTGLRHHMNGQVGEDHLTHGVQPEGGIAVAVGDGVSGGACGDIASKIATLYCTTTPAGQFDFQTLDTAVQHAISLHTDERGAATVAAVWAEDDGRGHAMHVGDCRVWQWRKAERRLLPLTRDQTYTQLGELPPSHIPPDNPARMVGCGCRLDPGAKLQPLQMAPGDLLLLTSDGLHDFLSAWKIEEQLNRRAASIIRHGPQALLRLARTLLHGALQEGSEDDASVLLLGFDGSQTRIETSML